MNSAVLRAAWAWYRAGTWVGSRSRSRSLAKAWARSRSGTMSVSESIARSGET